MYEITMTPKAKKELDKLSLKDFRRVDTAIWGLQQNPRPRGVKKLKGPIYRIRVGDWRVIYAVFDKDELVIVGKVERRSEDTYDRLNELF
ncbi:MAG: type II toxin-antitoxin system mRNA interferase toxin, RelE/StbE family [Chloroflexi bacterium CG07_land_8_20_14_0_80_51_10]|nr:MAG: type II toxin-antitoxin system mRNA interferase toxin, RelE/StbE family [Chloroflexi bacterium CG07_land_8_20_14_0_80_51_10]